MRKRHVRHRHIENLAQRVPPALHLVPKQLLGRHHFSEVVLVDDDAVLVKHVAPVPPVGQLPERPEPVEVLPHPRDEHQQQRHVQVGRQLVHVLHALPPRLGIARGGDDDGVGEGGHELFGDAGGGAVHGGDVAVHEDGQEVLDALAVGVRLVRLGHQLHHLEPLVDLLVRAARGVDARVVAGSIEEDLDGFVEGFGAGSRPGRALVRRSRASDNCLGVGGGGTYMPAPMTRNLMPGRVDFDCG